ncbi:hypothetical protein EDB87DRAFT_1581303 [Lactarius vividus]|nr:hypothetical protein EDB87DRAFT_1581303 [Lactarius vividus]
MPTDISSSISAMWAGSQRGSIRDEEDESDVSERNERMPGAMAEYLVSGSGGLCKHLRTEYLGKQQGVVLGYLDSTRCYLAEARAASRAPRMNRNAQLGRRPSRRCGARPAWPYRQGGSFIMARIIFGDLMLCDPKVFTNSRPESTSASVPPSTACNLAHRQRWVTLASGEDIYASAPSVFLRASLHGAITMTWTQARRGVLTQGAIHDDDDDSYGEERCSTNASVSHEHPQPR